MKKKTKSKTKTNGKAAPKDATPEDIAKAVDKVRKDFQKKPTVSFARDGHMLASLLWQKILASVTPEVQQMLFVHRDLDYIWDQMAPSDFDRVPHPNLTHEELLENTQRAKYLLTGFTNKTVPYVESTEAKQSTYRPE